MARCQELPTLETYAAIRQLREKAAELTRARDALKRRLLELDEPVGPERDLLELGQRRDGLLDQVQRLHHELSELQVAHIDRQRLYGSDVRTGVEDRFANTRKKLEAVKAELGAVDQQIKQVKAQRSRLDLDPTIAQLIGDESVAAVRNEQADRARERAAVQAELKVHDGAITELDRRQRDALGAAKAAIRPALEEEYSHHVAAVAQALCVLSDALVAEQEFCDRGIGYGFRAVDLVRRAPFVATRTATIRPDGRGIARALDPIGEIVAWQERARALGYET